jgi:hypothetical protein
MRGRGVCSDGKKEVNGEFIAPPGPDMLVVKALYHPSWFHNDEVE